MVSAPLEERIHATEAMKGLGNAIGDGLGGFILIRCFPPSLIPRVVVCSLPSTWFGECSS